MITSLINPADSAERRTEKLLTIAEALMRRVEQATDDSGAAISPAIAARAAPRAMTPRLRNCTLTPMAADMAVLEAAARIHMPRRMRWISRYRPSAINSPTPMTAKR